MCSNKTSFFFNKLDHYIHFKEKLFIKIKNRMKEFNFNENQKMAVEYPYNKPLICIAGPGSGLPFFKNI